MSSPLPHFLRALETPKSGLELREAPQFFLDTRAASHDLDFPNLFLNLLHIALSTITVTMFHHLRDSFLD